MCKFPYSFVIPTLLLVMRTWKEDEHQQQQYIIKVPIKCSFYILKGYHIDWSAISVYINRAFVAT